MPQALLPLIPDGATRIDDFFSVVREDGQWRYYLGVRPMFAHDEQDQASFRMFTSQLICQGCCQQTDIVRTFGVSANSVKRSVKKFREQGPQGFYQPRRRRGATVLTPEVARQAQERLYRGESRHHVAEQLGIKLDTLRKAIVQGRLSEPQGDPPAARPAGDSAVPSGNDPAASTSDPPVDRPCGDPALRPCSPSTPTATDKSQRTVPRSRRGRWPGRGLHARAGSSLRLAGPASRRCGDTVRTLSRRSLWRRDVCLAGPGPEWTVSASG